MAGEAEKHETDGGSGVVLFLEQSANALMKNHGTAVSVLEPKDWAGPDTMVVHPAVVDKNLCAHCLACIKLCPSLSWDLAKAQVIVNEVSCKGCGICGSVCPAGAISQRQFSAAMVFDALDNMWENEGNDGGIYSCNTCPIEPLGLSRMKTPHASGVPVRIICSGRVEPIHVIETAQIGARGLLMIDCFSNVKEKDRFEKGRGRLDAGARLLRTLGSPAIRIDSASINSESVGELGSALYKFSSHHSKSMRGEST